MTIMQLGTKLVASMALAAAAMRSFGQAIVNHQITQMPAKRGRRRTARHKRKDYRYFRFSESRLNMEERFRKTGSWHGAINGDNAAGTKLARKARQGILTIRKGW